eukprot:CAMPEP_0175909422 /NCGR_PEP_ID=MMETSP0108-20121206/7114_1 /TAXON_ID=195067 ORGANISM="Goniomonas pacifica, Strain CCMP1869" /NCGR_SAMPLE_ID=MMETSP0108 /ASSEMBLY_ACC=CAM_ASM_000204 /LENGTH=104 /DNA_ID=CAMNT_0017231525 /DNA_START=372 /DNA_END=686 /DNA_ORIENTATION=-
MTPSSTHAANLSRAIVESRGGSSTLPKSKGCLGLWPHAGRVSFSRDAAAERGRAARFGVSLRPIGADIGRTPPPPTRRIGDDDCEELPHFGRLSMERCPPGLER